MGFLAEPVLVGRERELEELMTNFDSVLNGQGSTVFISGEAGSGKSRLVKEFLEIIRKKDILVISSGCLSDVAVPYFPFMEAFSSYFSTKKDEIQESEIRSWLMGPSQSLKTEKNKTLTPQAWKDLTFVAVTNTLLSISSKKPTVMLIEDIHWADSASLALLHYISRAIGSKQVFLLATFRSEEATSDAEGHPHPLIETLRLMDRERLFKEIKISSFNQESVAELAKGMVGGSLEATLLERLSTESHGNALFVVESLRMLAERGSLVNQNNQWSLSIDELDVPSKFKDIILRRIGTLKQNQRRVLDMASVIGDHFSPELLGFVLGQEVLDVLETLNSVAQSTSLVQVEQEFYRFDHIKTRKIIYEEIPLPLKKAYHARVAQKLEKSGKELPLSDLAYHFTQAGNKEKAITYAFEAAEDALARFSNVEAIKHFNNVLRLIEEASGQTEQRIKALQGLGEAYFANSMFKDALKAFESIYTTETGIAKIRAYRWALDSAFFQGDTQHLSQLVNEAEKCVIDDRLECARVLMNRGRSFLLLGEQKKGLEDFEEALRVDQEEYSLADTARTLVGLGPAYSVNRQFDNALISELRAIAIYEEMRDLRGQMDACNRAAQFGFRGINPETKNMYIKAIQIGEQIGDFNRAAEATAFLAQSLELAGDIKEALTQSLKALEFCNKTDSIWTAGTVYANLVRQYTKLGNIEQAQECFDKLIELQRGPLAQIAGLYGSRRLLQDVLSRAVLFAGKNQWKEANQSFNEIFAYVSEGHGMSPIARRTYAWALEKQGLIEEAKAIREENLTLLAEATKRFEILHLRSCIMARTKVGVCENFEARLDVINVSKVPSVLIKIENLPSTHFKITTTSSEWSVQDGYVNLKDASLDPFNLKTIKLNLEATRPGSFTIEPNIIYKDLTGEIKTCLTPPISITVNPSICGKIKGENVSVSILPNRVATGYANLNLLLYGGIPENQTIILVAPPSDERELLIKSILRTGINAGEPTFYLTGEIENVRSLLEKTNFYVFVCNPRMDTMDINHPNVFRLKGVENLTEIDIALIKAFRSLSSTYFGTKRICIEITSDVLLQHHAVLSRKWLSGLLADLKTKGFTTIAVIDPQMHPKEEVQAISSLFDGELRVTEKESEKGSDKILRVTKLHNQKYLNEEIILDKEKLAEVEFQ